MGENIDYLWCRDCETYSDQTYICKCRTTVTRESLEKAVGKYFEEVNWRGIDASIFEEPKRFLTDFLAKELGL